MIGQMSHARTARPPLAIALLAAAALPALAAPPATPPAASAQRPAGVQQDSRALPAGRFGTVHVYSPTGTPLSVAIFVSGDGGWELGVINMARALRSMGALVIGVNVQEYFASLRRAAQRADAHCQMIAADFESLSHQVQKQLGLREYHVPVLVG